MEDLKWVHQLVDAEKKMEERGLVDMAQEWKSESFLRQETIDFLKNLKSLFIDAVGLFNQGRPFTTSPVNIYSIAGKPADFMLFRNACKLLFALKDPGCIQVHRAWIRRFYLPETFTMTSGKQKQKQRPTTNSGINSSTQASIQASTWAIIQTPTWAPIQAPIQAPTRAIIQQRAQPQHQSKPLLPARRGWISSMLNGGLWINFYGSLKGKRWMSVP